MNPQQNKPSILELIAREIVALSRHGSILVFANSRRVVEALADVLNQIQNAVKINLIL